MQNLRDNLKHRIGALYQSRLVKYRLPKRRSLFLVTTFLIVVNLISFVFLLGYRSPVARADNVFIEITGSAAVMNNATHNDSTPGPFQFSLNGAEGVAMWRLQISVDPNFSSSTIDVQVSNFVNNGPHSFTVGDENDANGMALTYWEGSSATTLTDAVYYWRMDACETMPGPGPCFFSGEWETMGILGESLHFQVDTVGPTQPTIDDPTNAELINDSTPTIVSSIYSADNGTHDASQWIIDDSADLSSPIIDTGDVNDLETYTVPGGSELADGTWYVGVRYKDSLGNYSDWSTASSFTLDATGPDQPTIDDPTDDEHINSNSPSFTGSVFSDALGTHLASHWQIDTVNTFNSGNLIESVDDTINLTAYNPTPATLADGVWYARVRYKDNAGNYSSYSTPISFTVDTTAPSFTVTSLTSDNAGSNTVATTGDLLTLVFTSDEALEASPEPTVNLEDANYYFFPFTFVGKTGNEYTYTYEMTGGEAAHWPGETTRTVYMAASDLAGNAGANSGGSINFDFTSPNAPGVSVPVTDVFVNADTYTIEGTADADSLVTIYTDPNNDGNPADGVSAGTQQLTGGGTTFSIEVNLTADSANYFVVSALDLAYNQSAYTDVPIITEDSTAPETPSITDPATDLRTSDTTPSFTSSAFSDTTSHKASQWLIDDNPDFSSPTIDTGDDEANLETYTATTLSDATYYVKVRYKDIANNYSAYSSAITVHVDTTAPTFSPVTVESDNGGSNTVATTGNVITVSFSSNEALDADPTVSFQTYGQVFTKDPSSSGNDYVYTYTVIGNETQGALSIQIDGEDVAGNIGQDLSGAITLDFTAPSAVTVSAPADVDYVNSATYLIEGTADADSLITLYTDPNNDGNPADGEAIDTQQLLGGGTAFSIEVPLTADTEHYFVVTAKDLARNESSVTDVPTIVEDSTNPITPSITDPASATPTNDVTPTFTGSAYSDTNTHTTSEWLLDTVNTFNSGDLRTIENGTDLTTYSADTLPEGTWYIKVRYKDAANNYSDYSAAISVIIDTTAPTFSPVTVESDNAGSNTVATTGDVITVSFTTDGAMDEDPTVIFQTYGYSFTKDPSSSGNNYVYTYTIIGNEQQGSLTIQIDGTDTAGNAGQDASQTFTIDYSAPASPSVTDPADVVTVDAISYEITGISGEADMLITAYTDPNNDGDPADGSVAGTDQLTGGDQSFAITVSLSQNAENYFVVTAKDLARNESPAADVPTITEETSGGANSAPSVSDLGPTALVDGSYTSDSTPGPFTFTTADVDGSDTVQFQIQIDDNSDFSSPIVDYTSALETPGAKSFTVGQVEGSGTYNAGSDTTTLLADHYYWRVKAIDNNAGDSGYTAANSGNEAFAITPSLSFSIGATSCAFGTLSLVTPSSCTHTLAAATNAQSGYSISYGPATTLTFGGHTISAIGGTAATSSAGTEQFGLNLRANTTPNAGANPSGGSGAAASNYNTANQFAFTTAGATVASASGASSTTTFTVCYIANIASGTQAGSYNTQLIYNITANY